MEETTTKTALEIGDKVYESHYGEVLRHYTIERVTKTQAISGNMKFRIEVCNNGYVREVSRDKWSTRSYRLETPEIKDEYTRKNLVYQLKKYDFNTLSLDGLREIAAIINKS